jgi:hypothetical protein
VLGLLQSPGMVLTLGDFLEINRLIKCDELIHIMIWMIIARLLGWEFQFLVPIFGTPIGSRILIPFLIPKIPVGFFFFKIRC